VHVAEIGARRGVAEPAAASSGCAVPSSALASRASAGGARRARHVLGSCGRGCDQTRRRRGSPPGSCGCKSNRRLARNKVGRVRDARVGLG